MSEVLHYPIDTTGKGDPRSIADYLELLAVMSQDFAMSLDIEATLERALDRIMDYLQAEGASIFLLENDNTELVCRVCVGPVDITGIRLGISEGIVGRTVRDNRSQMVRDVRRDPNFASVVDEKTGFVTRSILCAPLGVKDQRLGAIELVNKHAGDGLFSDRDRHLLEALAASAALAGPASPKALRVHTMSYASFSLSRVSRAKAFRTRNGRMFTTRMDTVRWPP